MQIVISMEMEWKQTRNRVKVQFTLLCVVAANDSKRHESNAHNNFADFQSNIIYTLFSLLALNCPYAVKSGTMEWELI